MSVRHWTQLSTGDFVERPTSIYWGFKSVEKTTELPQWEAVRRAAEADETLRSHFDKLVGTAVSASRMSLMDVARAVLPRPNFTDDGYAIAVESFDKFGEMYQLLEELLAGETVAVTRIWPLPELDLQGRIMRLDSHVTVRPLGPEEYEQCLNYEIIHHSKFFRLVSKDEARMYGLIITASLPKLVGDRADDEGKGDWEAFSASNARNLEDFQAALAVVGKSLAFGPYLDARDWRGGYTLRFSAAQPVLTASPFKSAQLSRPEQRLCKEAWTVFKRRGRNNDAVHTAALRLFFSQQRARPEDQLVDVVIAAEALYLGTGPSNVQGELQFQLALRAASWANLRKLNMSRREVFDLMKIAYGARSSVVHGSKIRQQKMKVEAEELTVDALLTRVRLIVDEGLKKALRVMALEPKQRFEVDWDRIVLGPRKPSCRAQVIEALPARIGPD